jgi:hypothetical protein
MIIMRLKVPAFKANHALVVLLQGEPCSVEYGGPLFLGYHLMKPVVLF